MKIDCFELQEFIKTVRGIVGRDEQGLFSLEDVCSLADTLRIGGVVYLEKFDDKRHATVLLGLDKNSITLYDPLLGVKRKPYNETHLGMYGQPVGLFKDEFQTYNQGLESDTGDVWTRYKERGKLLASFLEQNKRFKSAAERASTMDFPALQNPNSPDCAPIALFIMCLSNSVLIPQPFYTNCISKS